MIFLHQLPCKLLAQEFQNFFTPCESSVSREIHQHRKKLLFHSTGKIHFKVEKSLSAQGQSLKKFLAYCVKFLPTLWSCLSLTNPKGSSFKNPSKKQVPPDSRIECLMKRKTSWHGSQTVSKQNKKKEVKSRLQSICVTSKQFYNKKDHN